MGDLIHRTMTEPAAKRAKGANKRVGIIGFGKVGKFLTEQVLQAAHIDLAFVCDPVNTPTIEASKLIPNDCKCTDLGEYQKFNPDVIVEVAHPDVNKRHGAGFIQAG